MGKRTGGQGVVLFAEHVNAPMKQYAIKFFLSPGSFDVERSAACNPVRAPVRLSVRTEGPLVFVAVGRNCWVLEIHLLGI